MDTLLHQLWNGISALTHAVTFPLLFVFTGVSLFDSVRRISRDILGKPRTLSHHRQPARPGIIIVFADRKYVTRDWGIGANDNL
jgi:hypothetical protein